MKVNLLKAEIARAGMTQSELAKVIGMTAQTFSKRMKKQSFNLEEAEKIIKVLDIKNAADIFLSSH